MCVRLTVGVLGGKAGFFLRHRWLRQRQTASIRAGGGVAPLSKATLASSILRHARSPLVSSPLATAQTVLCCPRSASCTPPRPTLTCTCGGLAAIVPIEPVSFDRFCRASAANTLVAALSSQVSWTCWSTGAAGGRFAWSIRSVATFFFLGSLRAEVCRPAGEASTGEVGTRAGLEVDGVQP